MSKVRTRKLRKIGIKSKSNTRAARKYILTFPKCNQAYAFKNYAYSIGANYDLIFSTEITN